MDGSKRYWREGMVIGLGKDLDSAAREKSSDDFQGQEGWAGKEQELAVVYQQ